MNIPAELFYTKTDEWAKIEGKVATVGITDFAQDQLSDVVFVEIIVSPGDSVAKGQQIATVESVKAAADVNSPVSGKVTAVNEDLSGTPELVNKDAFGLAWLIKVELSDAAEAQSLLNPADYAKSIEERSH